MPHAISVDRVQLGACYYPEHWPESLWDDDFRRMRELGFSVVRVAEFAWSIFEPEEDEFTFDLFDRALAAAHRHGLQVILGTPTATPPAWLTHKYPEVLNVSQSGVQYRHGQRRHYNYNAPIYRELSARIVRRMAERYAKHPAVVGWQIDNELNCEVNVFYSAADQAAFRAWLQRRYGTLEALNAAWGAVFWNQTYTDWAQVSLTGPTPSSSPNPHQALDEKRFFSDSAISFAKMQADILRELAPGQWITTNGLFGHLDSHALTEQALDFFSYDSYPNFSTIYPDPGPDALLDRRWSWSLSFARSISPTFCVMEQQSGPGGWTNRMAQPAPKPGQMRLWTYQSIAHGADMVLYFRWRTATIGTEIYWHGINDYHNRPNRRVAEAARVGAELAAVGGRIAGARNLAELAILHDYDNEWDGELDEWHGPYARRSSLAWVKTLQRAHIPHDSLTIGASTTAADLGRYRVLVYPHPAILSDAAGALLAEYVRGGGTLIVGCRAGYKDSAGQVPMRPMPGPLADLCGVTVGDFTRAEPAESAPPLRWLAPGMLEARADSFADILESHGAEILAEYAGDYYAGAPALSRNAVGAGHAYYYGSVFTPAVAAALVRLMGLESPAAGWLALPPEVELCVRERESGERLWFLLNYSGAPQTVEAMRPATDLLSGAQVAGAATIEPYGVMILAE